VAGGTKTEVKLELSAMEGKAAHLKVSSHLPGADVLVDGQTVGKTPLTTSLTVTPGQHKIEMKRAGYLPAQQDLTLGDGASGDVTFEPEPDLNVLSTDGGSLALDISETQAVVTIDGKPRGPYTGCIKLPKGEHKLMVERGGFETLERSVSIDGGRTTTVPIELVPTPETRAAWVSRTTTQRTWGWISLFGGVAVAGGGVTLALLAASSKSDANADINQAVADLKPNGGGKCDNRGTGADEEPCLNAYNDALKRFNDAKTRQNIGYGITAVGGVAAGLGAYLLLTGDNPHRYDRKKDDNPMSLRVTPVVGPSGLGFVGTF
jgi:hypothetical protein